MPAPVAPNRITDVLREFGGDLMSALGGLVGGSVNGQTIGPTAAFTGTATVASSLSVGASGTPITQMRVYTPTLTPASVAINISAEQTFSVPGLTTADTLIVNGPAPTVGTGIIAARVSGADTLALTFVNVTIGILTPASGAYRILAVRS